MYLLAKDGPGNCSHEQKRSTEIINESKDAPEMINRIMGANLSKEKTLFLASKIYITGFSIIHSFGLQKLHCSWRETEGQDD